MCINIIYVYLNQVINKCCDKILVQLVVKIFYDIYFQLVIYLQNIFFVYIYLAPAANRQIKMTHKRGSP